MVRKSARHGLMEMLIAHGVEVVFGNPGTTELPVMDAIQDYPELKYILGLHESVAVSMADGYARAKGKPGFVNLHMAGGLANGISMLYNAFRGGTPLIVTAGQSDTRMLMEEPLLSGDLVGMCRQFTKWSGEVLHAQDVPSALRRAFRTASTPPTGPVFLSLPWNVLDEEVDLDLTPASPIHSRIRPDPQAVDRAAQLLAGAENPLMIVGDRIAQADAVGEAARIAEALGARVMAASYNEVNFPSGHRQFLGTLNIDSTATRKLFDQHDVILAVGCNLFTQFLYAPQLLTGKAKVVHLDINAWEIEKNYPVEVGVWGDIKAGLEDLMEAVEGQMSHADRDSAGLRASLIAEEREKGYEAYVGRARKEWEQKPMIPVRLFLEMKEVLPRGTILATEAVTATIALMRTIPFDETGTFFSLRGGALGWGIGGAMGIRLARPDRQVVAVIGDGSAMYSIQGLWTAATYDLPVVFVICNNRSYRILKHFMVNYYYPLLGLKDRKSRFTGMNFFEHPLDCAGVAEAFGVKGFRVEDPQEWKPTLEKALALGKPALVDVQIHPGPF